MEGLEACFLKSPHYYSTLLVSRLGDDLSWSALDYAGENALKKTFKAYCFVNIVGWSFGLLVCLS